MKSPWPLVAFVLLVASSGPAFAAPATETIVLIRHGEKPEGGLGRLDCRGRERAQALPVVLTKQFGRFDAIFAPDPEQKKKDDGIKYRYLRPVETVTPLSKATGLPVDTRFGYKEIGKLASELQSPGYVGATVLVAWEHKKLVEFVRQLLDRYGANESQVAKWRGSDFDSIYIVRIALDGGTARASFERRSEGLNGQLAPCVDD